jgi:hypothetical protein
MMSGQVSGTNAAGGSNFNGQNNGKFFTALRQGPNNNGNAISSTTDISITDCACSSGAASVRQ